MNDGPETAPQPETSGDVLTTIFEPIPPATGGRYVFTSERDALRTTLAKFGPRPTSVTARSHRRKPRTFKLTPSKTPKVASPVPVRIVIYPDRVKFEAKIDLALIGSILPTIGPIEGFSERSEPLCFVFDLNVLLRAASNIPGEGMMTLPDDRRVWVWGVRFEYEPVDSKHKDGAPVFRIRNINLPTLPFDTFLHTLGEITPVATFDPKVLRRGLFHARLFAKITAEDRSLTVIEVRGGAVFGAGADPTGICMFEAPCLAGITARVPLKAVGIVRRVLAHLDPGSARLLDCDTHHIIRDCQTWLAWPKTSVAFPLIETRIPEHHFDDRVTVSRSELRTSLLQLDIVRLAQVWAPTLVPDQDDDKDFLLAEHDGKTLQLRVSGEGSTAELSMHIRDSIGKSTGRCDDISCERTVANRDSGESPKAMDVMVDLLSFLKVVKHFGSPQVCFSVGRNSAGATTYFLIEDHDTEGAWRARTFLEIVPHLGRPPWSPVNPGRRRSGRRA